MNRAGVRAGIVLLSGLFLSSLHPTAAESRENAGRFKLTAYCACVKCCGKSDGITASGHKAKSNFTVACNWMKFGTRLLVNGRVFTVEDRGAKSLFGDKHNHIKHLDIFMQDHESAKRFGVQYADVTVL